MKSIAEQIRKYRFVVDNGIHSFVVDQPKEMGGSEKGPSPVQMMVMALSTCTGQMFAIFAGKTKLDYEDIEVTVQAEKNENNIIEKAHIVIRVVSSDAQDKIEKTVQMTLDNCPVGYMFRKSDVEMSHSLKVQT